MADLDPSERPLEVMPAMLNVALEQTGKFFRDAISHDSKNLNLAFTRRSINRAIQTAHEKFHHALDEIEIEMIRAKSVMERDLALIRLKRAERDKAQGALMLRDHSHQQGGIVGNGVEKMSKGDSRSIGMALERNEPADVVMIDAKDEQTAADGPTLGKPKPLATLNRPDIEHTNLASSGISQGTINSKGLSLTVDPSLASKEPTSSNVIMEGHDDPGKQSELPIETPTTANLRESDFETMFNDTEVVGGTQGLDFGLDFSVGAQGLNDAGFENSTMENEDLTNLNATSNEDINTLLPGLENYVNASGDFSIINPAAGPTLPNSSGATANKTLAPQVSEPLPTESNFDDLFSSSNFIEDAGDYEMDGSGDINDLGDFDDWFKSDT